MRRAVLDLLRAGPKSVADLASGLPVTRPAVSHHLKVLGSARLVRSTRRGTQRIYEIDPAGAEAIKAYAEELWAAAFADLAEAAPATVVETDS